MKKMIVTEFIVGKKAAENIYNKQGMLLLKAENVITESMVRRFEKEKIVAVWVEAERVSCGWAETYRS